MKDDKTLSDAQLQEMENQAKRLGEGEWRRVDVGLEGSVLRDAKGRESAYVFAPRAIVESLSRGVRDVASLAAALRKERAESRSLRDRIAELESQAKGPAKAPARPPAAVEVEEATFAPLAAPFRVSPAAAKAAQTDRLMALAVQVARALQEDAKDIERARLIAMALAVTTGDEEAFWAARRQRATKKGSRAGKT